MIRFACPGCSKAYTASEDRAGGAGTCPQCGVQFIIPGGSEPTPFMTPPPDDQPPRPLSDREPGPPLDDAKPGKINAIGGMLLGGGIWAILWALAYAAGSAGFCCLWPGLWFGFVWGILAIIKGSTLLGTSWRVDPKMMCVLQIVQIINLDAVNLVLGIVGLIFTNEAETQRVLRRS